MKRSSKLKLYLQFIANSFYQNSIYRFNTVFDIISKLVILIVQIAIWAYLLANKSVSSSIGVISMNDMITYSIISSFIWLFITTDVISRMHNLIKSGDISMLLIRPFSLFLYVFCESFGSYLYRIVFQLLPMVLVILPFYRIQLPKYDIFILFIVSLFNGVLINFIITYILGIVGFWIISVNNLSMLLNSLVRLLSGMIVPLWFFPRQLLVIADLLPFKGMFYYPISIFLNKMNYHEIVLSLANQIFWLVVLFIFQKFLYQRAIHKLVIQGG